MAQFSSVAKTLGYKVSVSCMAVTNKAPHRLNVKHAATWKFIQVLHVDCVTGFV